MASKKTFFSLLVGLAAGAALGILYAPDKGSKTRARVRKAAENGYEDLKENLSDLGAKASQKTDETKETVKNLRETLRERADEIKEDTRALLLDQLERLENALRQAETVAEAEETEVDQQDPVA